MAKNYYEILGLDSKCSQEEIKTAFTKRARAQHPDKAGDEATAAMQNLINAYTVLRDPIKRAAYDRGLSSANEEYTFQCSDLSTASSSSSTELVVAPIRSLDKTIEEANLDNNEVISLATHNLAIAKWLFTKTVMKIKICRVISELTTHWHTLINISIAHEEITQSLINNLPRLARRYNAPADNELENLALAQPAFALHIFENAKAWDRHLHIYNLVRIYEKHQVLLNSKKGNHNNDLLECLAERIKLKTYLAAIKDNSITIDIDIFYRHLRGSKTSPYEFSRMAMYDKNIIKKIIQHTRLQRLLTLDGCLDIAKTDSEFALFLLKNHSRQLNANDLALLSGIHPEFDLAVKNSETRSPACQDLNKLLATPTARGLINALLTAQLTNNQLMEIARKNKAVANVIAYDITLRLYLANADKLSFKDEEGFDSYPIFVIGINHPEIALDLIQKNKPLKNVGSLMRFSEELTTHVLNHIALFEDLESKDIYKAVTTHGVKTTQLALCTPSVIERLNKEDLPKLVASADLFGAQQVFGNPLLFTSLSGALLFKLSHYHKLPIVDPSQLKKVRAHLLLEAANNQPTGLNVSKKPTSQIEKEDPSEADYQLAVAYEKRENCEHFAEKYYFQAAKQGHVRALEALIAKASNANSPLLNFKMAELYCDSRNLAANETQATKWQDKIISTITAENISTLLDYIIQNSSELPINNSDLANLYLEILDELRTLDIARSLLVKIHRICAKISELYNPKLTLDYLNKLPEKAITVIDLQHFAILADAATFEKQKTTMITDSPSQSKSELDASMNEPDKKIERILSSLPFYCKAAAKEDAISISRLSTLLNELLNLAPEDKRDELIITLFKENVFILADTILLNQLITWLMSKIKNVSTYLQLSLLAMQTMKDKWPATVNLLLQAASKRAPNTIAEKILSCLDLAKAIICHAVNNEMSANELTFEAIKLFIHKNDYQHLALLERILKQPLFFKMMADDVFTLASNSNSTPQQIAKVANKISALENIANENSLQFKLLTQLYGDLKALKTVSNPDESNRIAEYLFQETVLSKHLLECLELANKMPCLNNTNDFNAKAFTLKVIKLFIEKGDYQHVLLLKRILQQPLFFVFMANDFIALTSNNSNTPQQITNLANKVLALENIVNENSPQFKLLTQVFDDLKNVKSFANREESNQVAQYLLHEAAPTDNLLECIELANKITCQNDTNNLTAKTFALSAIKLFIQKNTYQNVSLLKRILQQPFLFKVMANEFLSLAMSNNTPQHIAHVTNKIIALENINNENSRQYKLLKLFFPDLSAIKAGKNADESKVVAEYLLQETPLTNKLLKCIELANDIPYSKANNSLPPRELTLKSIKLFIQKNDYQHLAYLNRILKLPLFYATIANEFLATLSNNHSLKQIENKLTDLEKHIAKNKKQCIELSKLFDDLNTIKKTLDKDETRCQEKNKLAAIRAKKQVLHALNKDLSKMLTAYYQQDFSADIAITSEQIKNDCIASIQKHLEMPLPEMNAIASWQQRLARWLTHKLHNILPDKWVATYATHFRAFPDKSEDFTKTITRVFTP